MQQIESTSATSNNERKGVESVVETLSTLRTGGDSAAEIAHDARNMVTALGLYCDLLDEPGVFAPAFAHYAGELRLVAAASRKLVEKLVDLDGPDKLEFRHSDAPAPGRWPMRLSTGGLRTTGHQWDPMPSLPVANLATELLATRNLLAALSGPSIALRVDIEGGALPVRITGEDLTRVLVNLVKNAVEAMPCGGSIEITLREQMQNGPVEIGPVEIDEALRQSTRGQRHTSQGRWLVLSIEDSGPGIPADALEEIFNAGYTGSQKEHDPAMARHGLGSSFHQGLGLSISRSIVETSGGRIHAENRVPGGARMVLEFPVQQSPALTSPMLALPVRELPVPDLPEPGS